MTFYKCPKVLFIYKIFILAGKWTIHFGVNAGRHRHVTYFIVPKLLDDRPNLSIGQQTRMLTDGQCTIACTHFWKFPCIWKRCKLPPVPREGKRRSIEKLRTVRIRGLRYENGRITKEIGRIVCMQWKKMKRTQGPKTRAPKWFELKN